MRGTNRNLATAFVFLISIGFPATSGAVDFVTPKTYPVGTSPSAIVVGDFNGDGKPDLAVANSGSANVSILLGNGDGTFKAAVNFFAGPSPQALAVGDFNGDHNLDLIVISPGDPTNGISGQANLLLGNGDGTLQSPVQIKADQFPLSIAIGDFNGDKKVDLIVGDQSNASLSVLLGHGDGTFQPATTISLGSSGAIVSIIVSDFNGDGKPDLVVDGGGILLGNGDGTFQTPNSGVGSAVPSFISAGDFNNDHKVDLVGLSRLPPPPNCHEFCISFFRIIIYLGNGDGTFNPGVLVGPSFLFHSANIIAADFNADNKLDLFLKTGNLGILLLGEGNGSSFTEVSPIDSPVGAASLAGTFMASADFNGDGLLDIVLTASSNNSVTVLLNTSPTSGADLALTLNPTQANGALVGTDLSYTATVFSEGPQDASGVILTETLPSGLKLVSAQPSQGTCTGTTAITCDLSAMTEPSEVIVHFIVTPTAEGTLTDALQVVATQPDLNSKNNSASITITAVLPADLAVSATASQNAGSPGDKVTVSVLISNGGPAAATNVTLTDSTDTTQISNVTISAGSCTINTAWMNCALGTLASGANVTMTYIVTLGTAGFAANTTVSSDESDQNPNNNIANLTIAVSDFTVSPDAASLTVKRGGQVSEALTFGTQSGFAGTIALACSVAGPVPMPTCSISPASVTLGSNATLTVNAAALSTSLSPPWFEQAARLSATWFPLGLLGCVLATGFEKKRRRLWALCLLTMVTAILPTACGGGNSIPPPPVTQSYTVTVTATSGTVQHSTQVIVTVN